MDKYLIPPKAIEVMGKFSKAGYDYNALTPDQRRKVYKRLYGEEPTIDLSKTYLTKGKTKEDSFLDKMFNSLTEMYSEIANVPKEKVFYESNSFDESDLAKIKPIESSTGKPVGKAIVSTEKLPVNNPEIDTTYPVTSTSTTVKTPTVKAKINTAKTPTKTSVNSLKVVPFEEPNKYEDPTFTMEDLIKNPLKVEGYEYFLPTYKKDYIKKKLSSGEVARLAGKLKKAGILSDIIDKLPESENITEEELLSGNYKGDVDKVIKVLKPFADKVNIQPTDTVDTEKLTNYAKKLKEEGILGDIIAKLPEDERIDEEVLLSGGYKGDNPTLNNYLKHYGSTTAKTDEVLNEPIDTVLYEATKAVKNQISSGKNSKGNLTGVQGKVYEPDEVKDITKQETAVEPDEVKDITKYGRPKTITQTGEEPTNALAPLDKALPVLQAVNKLLPAFGITKENLQRRTKRASRDADIFSMPLRAGGRFDEAARTYLKETSPSNIARLNTLKSNAGRNDALARARILSYADKHRQYLEQKKLVDDVFKVGESLHGWMSKLQPGRDDIKSLYRQFYNNPEIQKYKSLLPTPGEIDSSKDPFGDLEKAIGNLYYTYNVAKNKAFKYLKDIKEPKNDSVAKVIESANKEWLNQHKGFLNAPSKDVQVTASNIKSYLYGLNLDSPEKIYTKYAKISNVIDNMDIPIGKAITKKGIAYLDTHPNAKYKDLLARKYIKTVFKVKNNYTRNPPKKKKEEDNNPFADLLKGGK